MVYQNYFTQKDKFKELFLNSKGRISGKTFVISLLFLFLSSFFVGFILPKFCSFFIPIPISLTFALFYAVFAFYATSVICIKRLRDIHHSTWFFFLIFIAPINFFFFLYLSLARGRH